MSTKTARAPRSAKPSTNGAAPARGFSFSEDSIGETVKADSLKLAPRKLSQKYAPLMQKVMSLKPGNALLLSVPKDTDMKRFRATIFSTLTKRTKGQLGKNRLQSAVTADGKLAIKLVPDER